VNYRETLAEFEDGFAHFYPKGFGFGAAGNGAAVIAAKDNDGGVF
jgi:hypothetical protein